MMSRQQDVCIKTLFTDRGGKYTSKEFEEYLAKKGTKHRLTIHDTPEQNGIAEQLNRTLVENQGQCSLNRIYRRVYGGTLFYMLIISRIARIHAVYRTRLHMKWSTAENQTYKTPTNGGKTFMSR